MRNGGYSETGKFCFLEFFVLGSNLLQKSRFPTTEFDLFRAINEVFNSNE